MIAELHIPLSRLFIGGFSQGGVLAAELVLRAQENSAGLLIFSGTLIHEELWESLAPLHRNLHFFQSHGRYDPLLPLAGAVQLEKVLSKAGCKGHLHVFEGGHEIPLSLIQHIKNFLEKSIA